MGAEGGWNADVAGVMGLLERVVEHAERGLHRDALNALDAAAATAGAITTENRYAVALQFAIRLDRATLAVAAGQFTQGRDDLTALRDDLAGTPYRVLLGHALVNLGFVLCEVGEFDPARDVLTAALAAYPVDTNPRHLGDVQLNLGTALLEAGQAQDALAAFRAARAIFEAINPQHRDVADAILDEGLALEEIGGSSNLRAAEQAFEHAMRLYRQDPRAAGDVADCWVNLAVLAEAAATADGVTRDGAAEWHQVALMRYCLAMSHYGMTDGQPVDLADCQLGLAGVLAGLNPDLLDEADDLARHAAAVYAALDQDLRWARAQVRLAELAEKRAERAIDPDERRRVLSDGARSAASAAVLLEHSRFQFESEGERRAWGAIDADNALSIALRLAAAAGDASLLTELIVTGRFVGALDLDSGQPALLGTPDPAPSRAGDSGGPALAASMSTARSLGLSFDRDAGPMWVMPDRRRAMQGAFDLAQDALKRPLRPSQEAHYR